MFRFNRFIYPKEKMKDGLGDILYLVAMAALFIFSSIMKSRKAKKNLPPQPVPEKFDPWEDEEEDTTPTFEDIFRTQPTTNIPEPAPVPVVAEGRRDIVKEREMITKQMFSTQQPAAMGPDSEKKQMFKEDSFEYSEVDGTHDTDSYWDHEEFDLKKAVVFSEILKRPEL